jgi:hypothetical protein
MGLLTTGKEDLLHDPTTYFSLHSDVIGADSETGSLVSESSLPPPAGILSLLNPLAASKSRKAGIEKTANHLPKLLIKNSSAFEDLPGALHREYSILSIMTSSVPESDAK